MSAARSGLKVHLALATVSIIFGTNYVVTKQLMTVLPPIVLFSLRVIGAALLLIVIHRTWIQEPLQKGDLRRIAFYSLLGVVVNQILFMEGLHRTTPVNASVLVCTIPAFTFSWALILRKEQATPMRLASLALAFAGVAYLLGIENFDLSNELMRGNLYIVINASSFALYLVLTKPLVSRYRNPITVVRWTFTCAILATPFTAPAFGDVDPESLSLKVWITLGIVIVFPTVVTYLLNNWALQHADASLVAVYIYLQPVVAGTLSVLYLGEELNPRMFPAAAAVFLGVYGVSRFRKHP
ncbi:MAG: DMT family transporter [Planctomycetota bacterium]